MHDWTTCCSTLLTGPGPKWSGRCCICFLSRWGPQFPCLFTYTQAARARGTESTQGSWWLRIKRKTCSQGASAGPNLLKPQSCGRGDLREGPGCWAPELDFGESWAFSGKCDLEDKIETNPGSNAVAASFCWVSPCFQAWDLSSYAASGPADGYRGSLRAQPPPLPQL